MAGVHIKKIFTPLASAINYFPATQAEVSRTAIKNWRWAGSPSVAMAIKEASRQVSHPGRLYTFVACKPQKETNDQNDKLQIVFDRLEEEQSRNTVLEARLEARELQLKARQIQIENYLVHMQEREKYILNQLGQLKNKEAQMQLQLV